ncbi:hypothetical protein P4711_11215 [Peribacillus castrilensis]|nr:hypothetical protein [Peribacillus castrilensis]
MTEVKTRLAVAESNIKEVKEDIPSLNTTWKLRIIRCNCFRDNYVIVLPPKWYAHPLSPSLNREGLRSLTNTFDVIV